MLVKHINIVSLEIISILEFKVRVKIFLEKEITALGIFFGLNLFTISLGGKYMFFQCCFVHT